MNRFQEFILTFKDKDDCNPWVDTSTGYAIYRNAINKLPPAQQASIITYMAEKRSDITEANFLALPTAFMATPNSDILTTMQEAWQEVIGTKGI
jgi:hypothetical protein